jgi:hypothetical protein
MISVKRLKRAFVAALAQSCIVLDRARITDPHSTADPRRNTDGAPKCAAMTAM